MNNRVELATFGGGCFWCTEAVFTQLKGVTKVTSGFTGGTAETANYNSVCQGLTDHAEGIQIEYDADVIPFDVLVKVHLSTHNPTTLNRQGADIGAQYRSAIFYHNADQKKTAKTIIKKIEATTGVTIVTTLEAYDAFYKADDSHQQYFEKEPLSPYCQVVIIPKLIKLKSEWKDWLK